MNNLNKDEFRFCRTEFRTKIISGMKASGCDIEAYGLQIEHGSKRTELRLAKGRLESEPYHCAAEKMSPDLALKYLRSWWQDRKWLDGIIAANTFLHGPGPEDGSPPPYMVESALIRLLRMRGMDMEQFRSALARFVDGPPSNDTRLKSLMAQVYSTFGPRNRPAEFEPWCWRSNTQQLPGYFQLEGDIQFRLVGRNGWGFTPIVPLAPGAMWIGGPCPAIWLTAATVPESLMRASKGRPVTDVLGHEALDVPGLKVLSMRHDGRRTIVLVSAVKEDAAALAAEIRAAQRLAA